MALSAKCLKPVVKWKKRQNLSQYLFRKYILKFLQVLIKYLKIYRNIFLFEQMSEVLCSIKKTLISFPISILLICRFLYPFSLHPHCVFFSLVVRNTFILLCHPHFALCCLFRNGKYMHMAYTIQQ